MIVTLTPNPSVDQTLWLDQVEPGGINRVTASHLDPAGKGINAARMAHRLGGATVAFGVLAGEAGHLVEQALDAEGVPHCFVNVPGQTRINVTIVEQARATSFYGPGPAMTQTNGAELEKALHPWLRPGVVLVLAGSLPLGALDDMYARCCRSAHAYGVRVILDAEAEALRLGVEASPEVIKPNRREAEMLLGRSLPDDAAVVGGAKELVSQGIGTVVVSMGEHGAICASGPHVWRVTPPSVVRRSTVGAGDSMVAGIAVALSRDEGMLDGVRLGSAAGAATAATPGTSLGSLDFVMELLPEVRVEQLA